MKLKTILAALTLFGCAPVTASPGIGIGIGIGRHHNSGTISTLPSGVTYDTSIGLGVDATGRADLTPRVGAQEYYVNSTTGNDTNTCTQAKSASTPKATIKSAESCVTDGEGDQVLIAQGMSYPNGFAYIGDKGGFSAQYPVVYQSYDPADPTNQAKWGTATGSLRPDINMSSGADNSGGFIQGGTAKFYRAFRGLNFDGQNAASVEIHILAEANGEPSYMLFENDQFAQVQLTIQGTASLGQIQHVTLRNTSLYGEWGSNRAQGIFADNIDGLTIEDCVFWHNGWEAGANRSDDPSIGGSSNQSHAIYGQDTVRNAIVRRSVTVDSSMEAVNLKGGGVIQNNLSLINSTVAAAGSGNNYTIDEPFGAYIEMVGNAGLVSATPSTGAVQGWGFHTSDGRQNLSEVHHNVIANSGFTTTGYALMTDATNDIISDPAQHPAWSPNTPAKFALPAYADFFNNVSSNWNASGSTKAEGLSGTTNLALIHTTYNSNIWDDPASGSNANAGATTFTNAYTESTLLAALGYADEPTAAADWIAHPEQHKWENGPTLLRAGYGVTAPALTDLRTDTRLTNGLSNNGSFIFELDGSSLTATNLPPCVTIDSSAHAWRSDGSCTTGSWASSITETNGANSHTTSLTWTSSPQPVLSSVTVTPGTTTATINLSSNTGNGTLFWMATSSSGVPTWPEIRDDVNADTNSAGYSSGNQAVTATGAQPAITASGLPASTALYACVAQLDSGNNPSATTCTPFTTTSSWSPASLGANLAFDFTHLDSSHLFTDTGCTTALTTDGQTAKCIKDTTTGVTATNATGWVYHANSGKPYLQMDGTSFFRTAAIAFTDASGQVSMWAVVAPAVSGNNALLGFFGHTLLIANPGLNRSQVTAYNTTPSSIGQDFKSGTALNTAAVFSGIITTSTAEVFVDNATDGSTAISGTLYSGSTLGIDIGNTATGPFYGAWMEKAVADSTTQTNAQTYGAALHP